MFNPLPNPRSSVEQCADVLRAAILDGRLGPGDKLPPERALAADFGVNRLTLRAALAKLTTQGLVAARQGSGYRVLDYRRTGGPALITGLVQGDGGGLRTVARDLLRVRRHLAHALLEHLQLNPSTLDLGPTEAAVEAFAAAVVRGAPAAELVLLDLDVIATLVDAADSPVFALCLNPLTQALHDLPQLRDAVYRDPSANVMGYRALLGWLSAETAGDTSPIMALLRERDQDTLEHLEAP